MSCSLRTKLFVSGTSLEHSEYRVWLTYFASEALLSLLGHWLHVDCGRYGLEQKRKPPGHDSNTEISFLSRRTWSPTKGPLLPERTLYPPFTLAQSQVDVMSCAVSPRCPDHRGVFEEVSVRLRTTPVTNQEVRESNSTCAGSASR
jgi:hypothetical protein